MEENSVLKFTYELSVENKLPFLDAMITVKGLRFESSVYRKPTDAGKKTGKANAPQGTEKTSSELLLEERPNAALHGTFSMSNLKD